MTQATTVDGRRTRGDRARLGLLEGTLRVIERDGVAGVTHRKVTREAGLPATSAAYHFASISELLEAALLWADEQSGRELAAIGSSTDPVRALAHWLVESFDQHRARCIAEYELFLHAARNPSLRPAARRWLTDLGALVSTWTEQPLVARAICAYVDGLLIQSLVLDEAPDGSEVEATLRQLTGIRPTAE